MSLYHYLRQSVVKLTSISDEIMLSCSSVGFECLRLLQLSSISWCGGEGGGVPCHIRITTHNTL